MKLKAAFRYQAVELMQCVAAFYLIIGAAFVIMLVYAMLGGGSLMMPDMSFLSYAILPLLALSIFSDDVRFLLQMGLSRDQVFASAIASFAATCLFLALVEAVCAILLPFWLRGQSLFSIGYGPVHDPASGFLFMLLGCAAASAMGLALAAVRMRFGTRRLAIAFVVLVLAGNFASQLVDAPTTVFYGVAWLFGFGEGASLANPFIMLAIVTVLGLLVAWTAVRRIEVR